MLVRRRTALRTKSLGHHRADHRLRGSQSRSDVIDLLHARIDRLELSAVPLDEIGDDLRASAPAGIACLASRTMGRSPVPRC